MKPFTLESHRWYAMQTLPDRGAIRYSPVWIIKVTGLNTGRSILALRFWHANYPAGVQDKQYEVQVLRRASEYLLAERIASEETGLLLLTEVTGDWLHRHFNQGPDTSGDVQRWLDGNSGHP